MLFDNYKMSNHFVRKINREFGIHKSDVKSFVKKIIKDGQIEKNYLTLKSITLRRQIYINYKDGKYVYSPIHKTFITCWKLNETKL